MHATLPTRTTIERAVIAVVLLLASGGQSKSHAAERAKLAREFTATVAPFLKTYCVGCHGPEKQEAELSLDKFTSPELALRDIQLWNTVRERLQAEEMPPADAPRHPAASERSAVAAWIERLRTDAIGRRAGDPGPVLARRLSNAEYDNTIRELTGCDLRPTREFPVDPANQAGFDNSGESLAMSPELLKKHLAAARHVADHLVLRPQGFVFAPHPVVTETDRDKYCVRRIVDFYDRQRLDYADFFQAAWRYRHRQAIGIPNATLADFATEADLSAKYLTTIWSVLESEPHEHGPLATLQAKWRDLPPPAPNEQEPEDVRRGCEAMRDFVAGERERLIPPVGKVSVKGISSGSQPLVLWIDRQLAANRRKVGGPASGATDPGEPRAAAAIQRFCEVFPDAFFVSRRGRMFLAPEERAKEEQARLLSAGFHLMVGYFRDDRPLYDLVLVEREQQQLDALWRELDFVALAPLRQYKDFVFFERAEPPRFMEGAEFDFARSEDHDVISEAKMSRLAEAYLAKARQNGAKGPALAAIETYFTEIAASIRAVEEARLAAEPGHLEALAAFSELAYRRPLSDDERTELIAFYRSLRTDEGLGHEDALRDSIASILVSPHFNYRVAPAPPGKGVRELSDYDLASRLSYFLWSSMPDDELLAQAKRGRLHRPEVLMAQARRMMRHDRVRGLASEFGGNWLDFRRFETHNSVDRARFPAFNDALRQAMFEEPIRFLMDIVQHDRSVLDALHSNRTFVNPILAKHYGMPVRETEDDVWTEVDRADEYGRGGFVPMSVFLTSNSPGLRTSPVKRGYWVVRRLLGEHIPPPPPDVPELPHDEAELGELTVPQLLAKHRENKSCAQCHTRFDSIGLALEGFGPIGERRTVDLGGRPVDSHAVFPDGKERTGLDGLGEYLRDKRQDDFLDNLCRKLLAYALGRTLIYSDEPLIESMRSRLAANDHKFSSLVETIVASPQFLKQREADHVVED